MGRKVFVTSDMSIDERIIGVAEKNPQAALLWPWILTAFDDWGRANADPKRLKASVFPAIETVTPDLIASALELYAEAGIVILYEQNDKTFMAIPPEKWFKYQTHIRGEKRTKDNSRFPAPPSAAQQHSAHVRVGARNDAQMRADERICTPSPSPSPTVAPSPSSTPPPPSPTPDGAGEGAGVTLNTESSDKPREPTIEDVFARYPRYSSEQWATIRDYWDLIRFTRKTGRVAPNVVAREMDYWERFPPAIVVEALTIHIRKHESKQEDYTRGIIRRLAREKDGCSGEAGRDFTASACDLRGQARRPTASDYTSGRYGRFFDTGDDAEARADP